MGAVAVLNDHFTFHVPDDGIKKTGSLAFMGIFGAAFVTRFNLKDNFIGVSFAQGIMDILFGILIPGSFKVIDFLLKLALIRGFH